MIFNNSILTNLRMIASYILVSMTFVTLDESYYANIEVETFSYQEVIDVYDINEYNPGVCFDGFNNNSICDISNTCDVVKQAKKECYEGLLYDSINVYHDEDSDMWMVMFSKQNWTGGYCVYMNGQGITTLTVAGE